MTVSRKLMALWFGLVGLVLAGCASSPGSTRIQKPVQRPGAATKKPVQRPSAAAATRRHPSVVSATTGEVFKLPFKSRWSSDFSTRLKTHEPKTNKLLNKMALKCPDNSVIIDVGAHVGDTGLVIAKNLLRNNRGNVLVYQIDPDATKLQFLARVAKLNEIGNIKIVRAGLSDKPGRGKAVEERHPGAWTVKETSDGDFPLTTIDALFASLNVCYIHLDVEGFEYKSLVGSKHVLKKQKPPVILEYLHGPKEQIKPLLTGLGYKEIWGAENNILFEHRPPR